MAETPNLEITGYSGVKYTFGIYPLNTTWNEVGAVYVVTKRTQNQSGVDTYRCIYIGQTGNMQERHANHHKADCFSEYGADTIGVYVVSDEDKRLEIETDLLSASFNWPCNG